MPLAIVVTSAVIGTDWIVWVLLLLMMPMREGDRRLRSPGSSPLAGRVNGLPVGTSRSTTIGRSPAEDRVSVAVVARAPADSLTVDSASDRVEVRDVGVGHRRRRRLRVQAGRRRRERVGLGPLDHGRRRWPGR